MEVIETRAALLSNYEVLQLLSERIDGQKQRRKDDSNIEYPENLRTIQFEVLCLRIQDTFPDSHFLKDLLDQNSAGEFSLQYTRRKASSRVSRSDENVEADQGREASNFESSAENACRPAYCKPTLILQSILTNDTCNINHVNSL